MSKENNCQCVVCSVEASLLDSLSTQPARTHFQALASNCPALNDFRSPVDLVAQLHEQGNWRNHNSGSEILHAVIHAMSGPFEQIGQQVLLLAFTPAIHKTYREICQRFPTIPPEEVAQQAWVIFLEQAKSQEMLSQNGTIVLALVRRFRQGLFRWAMKEARLPVLQSGAAEFPELLSDGNFEATVLLDDFLQQSLRAGVLSTAQYKLLLRFKYEGFHWKELGDEDDGPSATALYYRVQRAINRLRRAIDDPATLKARGVKPAGQVSSAEPQKKFYHKRSISPGRCAFSKSEKGFSPEPSRPMPRVGPDMAHVAA